MLQAECVMDLTTPSSLTPHTSVVMFHQTPFSLVSNRNYNSTPRSRIQALRGRFLRDLISSKPIHRVWRSYSGAGSESNPGVILFFVRNKRLEVRHYRWAEVFRMQYALGYTSNSILVQAKRMICVTAHTNHPPATIRVPGGKLFGTREGGLGFETFLAPHVQAREVIAPSLAPMCANSPCALHSGILMCDV